MPERKIKRVWEYTREDIKNEMDIRHWIANLVVNELGVGFHPENDFSTYSDSATGKPSFTTDQAATLNDLMEHCFDTLNIIYPGTTDANVIFVIGAEIWYACGITGDNVLDEKQGKALTSVLERARKFFMG